MTNHYLGAGRRRTTANANLPSDNRPEDVDAATAARWRVDRDGWWTRRLPKARAMVDVHRTVVATVGDSNGWAETSGIYCRSARQAIDIETALKV